MQKLIINGGNRLNGEIAVQGAKNAVLPILAAAVLCKGEVVLHNCPRLSDVYSAMRILTSLGCFAGFDGASPNTVCVNTDGLSSADIPDRLMREMRSSIFFLGALVGRTGGCKITLPGGCDLGQRPIDIHINALRKMGVTVTEQHGEIVCRCGKKLRGAKLSLPFPSVGATENIILAAVLNLCGADIIGARSSTIVICGKKELHGCEFTVMPDRIAAATYLSCAACAKGEIILKKCCPKHLDAVLSVLEQLGCSISCTEDEIFFSGKEPLHSIDIIRTMVYPGFPTDCQAFIMSAACIAQGTTVFVENIFENRYRHAEELRRMGANIRTEGKVAVVEGVKKLYGAKVCAPDLRGGAGLVAAALCADGKTEISGVNHIDRGYEDIENVLADAGADIKRIDTYGL